MNHPRTALVVALGLWVTGQAGAVDKEIQVGDRTPTLIFKDIHYLPRALEEFVDRKAVVLIFTNTTCPLVQRYFPTLKALDKEYCAKGVQFLAVNVGADDTIIDMAAQAVRFDICFPFVKDFDAQVAETLGVKRTPAVVMLDGERRLRYRGRIDDQYRLVGTRAAATRHDLREALEAVLAGRDVAVKETPVDGCLITRPPPPSDPNP
jgi:thiol-disulfide isomerase/thioredoxin